MICLRHLALNWWKNACLVIKIMNICIALSAMIDYKKY